MDENVPDPEHYGLIISFTRSESISARSAYFILKHGELHRILCRNN
jgi:hypothetical protein